MRFHNVEPDETSWGTTYRYNISARHKWGLPGVRCGKCSSWGVVGLAYPLVDLSSLPREERLRHRWPVSPHEFRTLLKEVRSHLPANLQIIEPGTDLGPLVGRASGTFGDFAWVNKWTPLITVEAADALRQRAVLLPPLAQTEIQLDTQERLQFLELQIEPRVALDVEASEADIQVCAECGRKRLRRLGRIVIASSSAPSDVDIYRIVESPTQIICSERFADSAIGLNLKDIRFEPVAASV